MRWLSEKCSPLSNAWSKSAIVPTTTSCSDSHVITIRSPSKWTETFWMSYSKKMRNGIKTASTSSHSNEKPGRTNYNARLPNTGPVWISNQSLRLTHLQQLISWNRWLRGPWRRLLYLVKSAKARTHNDLSGLRRPSSIWWILTSRHHTIFTR